MTSKVTYIGDLRTENVHVKSNNSFLTDAPIDNSGKGEGFSPTDTIATGLASCMLTVMGIKARDLGVNIIGVTAEVTKTMASGPRRISHIKIVINLPFTVDDKIKTILNRTATTCPVYYSLHPDIKKDIKFIWK